MLLKIFCIAFDSVHGGFDEEEYREFIKNKEILSVQDHLFIKNEIPYLTLIVKYFPLRQEANPQLAPKGKRDEEWRQLLNDSDLGLFNVLREWRSKRCKEEGVPPYILLTNIQLAHVVKNRPQSLAELTKIDGVGKAKADKYGADIVDICKIKTDGKNSS